MPVRAIYSTTSGSIGETSELPTALVLFWSLSSWRLCCRFIWEWFCIPLFSSLTSGGGGRSGYAALLLNCSSTAAKPEPNFSADGCCFVGRGDKSGDDDNDDDGLLALTVAGCGCWVWLPEPVLYFCCVWSSDDVNKFSAAIEQDLPLWTGWLQRRHVACCFVSSDNHVRWD